MNIFLSSSHPKWLTQITLYTTELFLIDNFEASSQFPILFDLSAVYNWPLCLASITSFSWLDSALPWLFYICKSLLLYTLSLSFSVLHVPDCGWSTGPAFNTPVLPTPFLLEWSHLYPWPHHHPYTTDFISDYCPKFHFHFSKCFVDISTWMFKWHWNRQV